jgi:Fe2+ transport system protein B
MSAHNWDEWSEQLLTENKCSAACIVAATQAASTKAHLRNMERKQRDIKKAVAAVKKAYEENPDGSREEIQKAAHKNITGSVILSLIIYAVLSVVVKMAIEWLLDKLFSK